MIIPSAEPFFFPGGSVGCLLVHGFTGTPKEMHWMGENLATQGFSVLGIRLAAHATRQEDMLRVRWQDWLANVEDGWHILRGATARPGLPDSPIFLMGLSMGGVLSLLFASQFPVAGVVAMSTPFELPNDWRIPYIKLFAPVQPNVPKGPPDWHNPEAAYDHIDYPSYPTRAIAEMRDLLVEMRAALPRLTAPVLLIHSRQDTSVEPANMQAIYDRLGSQDRQMMWVEDSGHVITREPPRQRVFQAAADFVRQELQHNDQAMP